MPGTDGFGVLEWLSNCPSIEGLVIVLSAYDGIREVKQAYALGAKSFLCKRCTRTDIKNLMDAFPEHWIRSMTPVPKAESDVTA
jgi:DNA-binding NarL/FixJ family response regulator